jgi:hypothetical protein
MFATPVSDPNSAAAEVEAVEAQSSGAAAPEEADAPSGTEASEEADAPTDDEATRVIDVIRAFGEDAQAEPSTDSDSDAEPENEQN